MYNRFDNFLVTWIKPFLGDWVSVAKVTAFFSVLIRDYIGSVT